MQKNTIYIKNPDDINFNFKENEELEMIILVNENIKNSYEYNYNFSKQNAKAKIVFLIIAKKNSDLKFKINAVHKESNTSFDLKFKTILFENAKISFEGNITVEKNLKKISSNIVHKNISLSKNVEIKSVPNLEIKSLDVEINHGFASSDFSKDLMYYLKSRGLEKKKINSLLTKSFLYEELTNLEKGLKKEIKQEIKCSILN